MDKLEKLNSLLALLRDDTITPVQVGQFLNIVLGVIKQAKGNFEQISLENQKKITEALEYIEKEHSSLLKSFKKDLNRAYEFLNQVQAIKTSPGKDGHTPIAGVDFQIPDEARIIEAVLSLMPNPKDNSKLIVTLQEELDVLKDKLDNLPKTTQKIVEKVGGARYLEQLSDVSIPITSKRKDALVQYDTTDNRWETGIALTVSTTAPTAPVTGDLWCDTS